MGFELEMNVTGIYREIGALIGGFCRFEKSNSDCLGNVSEKR